MVQDANLSFQPEILLVIPFSLGSLASLGMVDLSFIPFIDMGAVLFAPGNIELTIGRIISIASLLGVFFNREVGFRSTSFIDAWIVYVTIGLVLAPPLFPAFQDTLAQQPAAILSFLAQSTGFTIVSYLN